MTRRWRRLVGVVIAALLISVPPVGAQPAPDEGSAALRDSTEIIKLIELDGEAVVSVEFLSMGSIASLPATVQLIAATESVAAATVRITSTDDLAAVLTNPLVRSVVVPPTGAAFTANQVGSAQLNPAGTVVGADQMHQTKIRGDGHVIAMIDSGIEATHPDLASSVVFERCHIPVGADNCPNGTDLQMGPGAAFDDEGHGTNVAGTLTSDGNLAPVGIAPAAQLEVYKVGGPSGPDLADTLLALDYILVNRPDVAVINFSIASNQAFTGPCTRALWPAFFDIVVALRDRGTIVVAPTGNQFLTGQTSFPACLAPVVAVAGSSVRETLFPGSNIDSATTIAAPGDSITTTAIGQTVTTRSGTSFAVPIVAACVVLMMQDDNISAPQAMERLTSGRLRSSRNGVSVPWINCAPRCNGKAATVNLELGQAPTSTDDVILGTRGPDEIVAGQGNDTICGFDGDDTITAGIGDDQVFAGRGNDTVYGGPGDDLINGQLGDDVVQGGDGDDRLYGSWGADSISGGAGNDLIIGKAGRDWLQGDDGDDLIRGGSGSDTAGGGPGDDVILLDTGSDQATGGDGNDRLVGGGGWDVLNGGAGADECEGGFGIDQALSCEATSSVP